MKQLSRAVAPAPQRPAGALLRVGAAGDRLEQEADAVAARVLSGPRIAAPGLRAAPGQLQRDIRSPWSPDEGQRRDDDVPTTGGMLQRAPAGGHGMTTVSPTTSPTGSPTASRAVPSAGSHPVSPTGSPTTSPTLSPALSAGIHRLRGGGTPLPGAVRGLLEPRFGHDFGRVRIHRDSTAQALAERVNARAFTLGRDVVFGAGQYDTGSPAGLRLLAHELTHVVQQGAAPRHDAPDVGPDVPHEVAPRVRPEVGPGRAPPPGPAVDPARAPEPGPDVEPEAGPEAGPEVVPEGGPEAAGRHTSQAVTPARDEATLQRMAWFPNRDTGTAHAPWGDDGPQGRLLEARTDAGAAVEAWRPDDGLTFWCHGYTFGGAAATGGPYSVFGSVVPRVLQDDGWHAIDACMARPNDILVFYDHEDHEAHSGIVRHAELVGGQVDEALSDLQSKWGTGMLATVSWATNARQYGHYTAYSRSPLTGACAAKGANER